MPSPTLRSACEFVAGLELPAVRRTRNSDQFAATAPIHFDSAKHQAAVVGSEIISFVSGVTAERREALVNSALLAQLVAKKQTPDPSQIYAWYQAYFDVLTHIGWVVQDQGFTEYHESSDDFDAHRAVLAIAATLLGAAPTALAVVKATIDALQATETSSPWLKVFNRESRTASAARFQVSLAEQDEGGQFLVSLMSFGLETKTTLTQVLCFKARASEATLRHYSGRVTINTAVLAGVQEAIKAKLAGQASEYVKALPDL